MYRILIALALAGALAGCSAGNPTSGDGGTGIGSGTQPLTDEEQPTDVVDEGGTDTSDVNVYGTEANADLTMNDVTFDPDTGELVLNNMPFDGPDNTYAEITQASTGLASVGSSFDVYGNVRGTSNYYAVFRRSASGYSQVSAAGTDRYVTFGFGGAAAQRLAGDGSLPNTSEEFMFVGEYAAVRTVIDPDSGSTVQYVAGTSQIEVDIEDFDNIGAVEGIIVDRRFFDANGAQIDALTDVDYISLATAEINFDNWTINSSEAGVIQNGGNGATGTWEGLFTGPNGEEVAGVVLVEGNGPIGIDPETGEYITAEVRESGVFVGTR